MLLFTESVSRVMSYQQKAKELEAFLNDTQDGLYYLSHASIVVKMSGVSILFDPVLANPPHFGSWLFYPLMHYSDKLLDIDYCIISHQHQDHYDAEFLRLLSANTKILILEGRPQFQDLLHNEGIHFETLQADKLESLSSGIDYFGVNHDYNGIDSALAIRNHVFSVYHGNDCYLSPAKLRIVSEAIKKIDVACIPFAYIHWYPFLIENMSEDEKDAEAKRLVDKYMNLGVDQIRELDPTLAIPFGANMFYNDGIDTNHNACILGPHDFKKYIDINAPDISSKVEPLFAGAIITPQLLGVNTENFLLKQAHIPLCIENGTLTQQELHEGFSAYVANVSAFAMNKLTKYSLTDYKCHSDINFINSRLFSARMNLGSIKHDIYLSCMELSQRYLQIPLDYGHASYVDSINTTRHYHHFTLVSAAYKAYMSGEVLLGELIAASLFTLERVPNLYNLEVQKYFNNYL